MPQLTATEAAAKPEDGDPDRKRKTNSLPRCQQATGMSANMPAILAAACSSRWHPHRVADRPWRTANEQLAATLEV